MEADVEKIAGLEQEVAAKQEAIQGLEKALEEARALQKQLAEGGNGAMAAMLEKLRSAEERCADAEGKVAGLEEELRRLHEEVEDIVNPSPDAPGPGGKGIVASSRDVMEDGEFGRQLDRVFGLYDQDGDGALREGWQHACWLAHHHHHR